MTRNHEKEVTKEKVRQKGEYAFGEKKTSGRAIMEEMLKKVGILLPVQAIFKSFIL